MPPRVTQKYPPYPPYQQYPPGYVPEEPTLDVRDYLRPIWQRKWLILAITVIAIAGSYAVASRHTSVPTAKTYAASTEVYIEVADPVELIGASGAPNPPDGQQMSDICWPSGGLGTPLAPISSTGSATSM